MKRIVLILTIMLFLSPAFGAPDTEDSLDENVANKMFVICSPNRKMCTVGEHTMRSIGRPLYVSDGIVCSFNRKYCTNGFISLRSSEPIEIVANSVLCTVNKKTCAIGKHKLTSNSSEPLYVEDGVVCTSNKKLCTNGFRYMGSNVPLR